MKKRFTPKVGMLSFVVAIMVCSACANETPLPDSTTLAVTCECGGSFSETSIEYTSWKYVDDVRDCSLGKEGIDQMQERQKEEYEICDRCGNKRLKSTTTEQRWECHGF